MASGITTSANTVSVEPRRMVLQQEIVGLLQHGFRLVVKKDTKAILAKHAQGLNVPLLLCKPRGVKVVCLTVDHAGRVSRRWCHDFRSPRRRLPT